MLIFICAGCSPATRASAKLPFGALDTPAENSTIKGVSFASGWALSEDGVVRVAIYLDRSYLQDAVLKAKREDVARAFPQFAGVENMGWITELHTESLPIGNHEILARVISRKGVTRDLVPHRINIEH